MINGRKADRGGLQVRRPDQGPGLRWTAGSAAVLCFD